MANIKKLFFSAYKFDSMNALGFSAKEYSRMKHGSKAISRKFGTELAKKLLCSPEWLTMLPEFLKKEIVVCSAPWKSIGVASTHIKDYFLSAFNPVWAESNPSAMDLKVYRAHSYDSDYGSLNAEERTAAITSDNFHIDKDFIKGKILFFIDDVKITGSHEHRIQALLENSGFEGTVVYLYFAEYVGEGHPQVENLLNYAFVNDLLDINHIIKNEEFMFNTRVVKFILASDPKEFKNFIDYQSEEFIRNLRKEATGNEYHSQDKYKVNYAYLKSKLQ
jgi:hypothetical protein